jgi:hypothetical protein
MINLFHQCPACGGQLLITECKCSQCQLQMRGEFQLGQFSRLSEEHLTFIRVFLTARGNLSEVERILGISYPTIRNKLEEINLALDKTDKTARENAKSAPSNTAREAEEEKSIKTKLAEIEAQPVNQMDADRNEILQKVSEGKISAADALQKLKSLKG